LARANKTNGVKQNLNLANIGLAEEFAGFGKNKIESH
jgi:hypothetical protein